MSRGEDISNQDRFIEAEFFKKKSPARIISYHQGEIAWWMKLDIYQTFDKILLKLFLFSGVFLILLGNGPLIHFRC